MKKLIRQIKNHIIDFAAVDVATYSLSVYDKMDFGQIHILGSITTILTLRSGAHVEIPLQEENWILGESSHMGDVKNDMKLRLLESFKPIADAMQEK